VLCRRGRFEALEDRRPRLLEPLIKENGRSVPASWNWALAEAARHLFNETPEQLGLLTSTRLTSEALGLLVILPSTCTSQRGRPTADRVCPPCGKAGDIAGSDLILLVAADPRPSSRSSFLIKRAMDQGRDW
jgi:predicted molibdopterin-dependent oxidoreductase YjgC